jgi:hypothetical protein
MVQDEWHGMYGEGWTGVITPESFAHPAKYSRTLIRHIYQHVIDEQWVHQNDYVVDPFGGVALGGFDAMQSGLHWTGCELEPRFHALGNQNIALWNDRYSRLPKWGSARLVQGDSRNLASVIGEASCCVSSPPYSDGLGHGGQTAIDNEKRLYTRREFYGQTEGQLGAMKEGNLHASLAVSSPPYAESLNHAGGIDAEKSAHTGGPNSQMNRSDTRYGETVGQLGAMRAGRFECAVSSPPYEGSRIQQAGEGGNAANMRRSNDRDPYGGHVDNLGKQSGDTFWSASRTILEQLHQVLTPNAHAVFVVKRFVRNKQIVDFPAQWTLLCQSVGFKLIHDHHALLVERYGDQGRIDGGADVKTISRKSFFRRLHEKKYPGTEIDHENVLCFERA